MIHLSSINVDARTVFLECIARVRDDGLRAKLAGAANEIALQEDAFDAAGKSGTFFRIRPHETVDGTVSTAEMKMVYEQQMVPVPSRGRVYYELIRSQAKNEECPMCAHRDVDTLDHYLPKAEYPGLAVSPKNLVPSCSHCNHGKLVQSASCATKQTLHPYYDNVDDIVWLTASFEKVTPVVVTFAVANGVGAKLPLVLARRLRHHFEAFELAKLYSSQATRELGDIKKRLTDLLDTGGAGEVRDHLKEEAASRAAAAKNSWRAALYRALSTSKWFCSVGCRG